MNLKKYIIEKSKRLNIDIIGFTNTDEFEELIDFLESRRKKQYETELEEVDIKKRISPKMILETGKSVIVIGVSYFIETEEIDFNQGLKGRLSKSSLGLDYHMVLKEKMKKLVEEIKHIDKDLEYSIGVDTTPIIDRYLAKKAGIGWYGKNSNIINDEYGSFIFIGYIITNWDIKQDSQTHAKCGDCNICIKSCPVGAIKQNYELNAKICISYLTQTKTEIPYRLRDKMKEYIYGCDICQRVCPKNKVKKISSSKEISEYIDIEELFYMSNKDFKNRYGHMAFSWRGKNIIKRNGIIVIGNLREHKNIGLLELALKDESSMIRKYAAWALLKIDKSVGLKILEKHRKYEKDESVNEEIEELKKYFKIC